MRCGFQNVCSQQMISYNSFMSTSFHCSVICYILFVQSITSALKSNDCQAKMLTVAELRVNTNYTIQLVCFKRVSMRSGKNVNNFIFISHIYICTKCHLIRHFSQWACFLTSHLNMSQALCWTEKNVHIIINCFMLNFHILPLCRKFVPDAVDASTKRWHKRVRMGGALITNGMEWEEERQSARESVKPKGEREKFCVFPDIAHRHARIRQTHKEET